MRKWIAATLAFGLGLAVAPGAWGQGTGDKGTGKNSEAKTICGVVAGVTAEGETVFDFRANRAVTVDAAYVTVVGSPKMPDQDKDKASTSDKKREDVYVVWLSPKTKVCECTDASGKSEAKKDCSFDRLEIGDRVEVQFVRRDDSQSGTKVHNEKSQMKHGRHRTFVGDANSITIMPPKHDDSASKEKSSSAGDTTSKK